jgi:hypothetical protein
MRGASAIKREPLLSAIAGLALMRAFVCAEILIVSRL